MSKKLHFLVSMGNNFLFCSRVRIWEICRPCIAKENVFRIRRTLISLNFTNVEYHQQILILINLVRDLNKTDVITFLSNSESSQKGTNEKKFWLKFCLKIFSLIYKRKENNARNLASKMFRLYISEKKITQEILCRKFFAFPGNVSEKN